MTFLTALWIVVRFAGGLLLVFVAFPFASGTLKGSEDARERGVRGANLLAGAGCVVCLAMVLVGLAIVLHAIASVGR